MFKKKLSDFFVPSLENSYAPHSLQKAAMVAMLFLVVLSFTATNILSLVWMSSHTMISSVLPAVVIDLTNKERNTDALGTLRRNGVLDAAAKLKAEDMAKNSYFAHYSPAGVSPWHWFGVTGYSFVHAGENLAIHFSDSGDIVNAWMDSPTHRANILNGNYTEIGVGTAEGSYEGFKTVYVVQLFGTPAVPVATTVVIPAPKVAGESTDVQIASTTEATSSKQVLAESVTVTESVKRTQDTFISTTTNSEKDATTTVTTTVATTSTATATTSLLSGATSSNEVVVKNETGTVVLKPILYSDFISTSTSGIPATLVPIETNLQKQAPFLSKLVTQPHKVLQIAYILIGLFVGICILLSIFIEIKYQQPRQIAYGVGLLILMCMLFYAHTLISTGALII